jgi:hypothetical protein
MATRGESADPGEIGANEVVYHIELRQFPHSYCRFNLNRRELLATVVGPWAREEWIELGERKWNPHQAKLTVIESPRIPMAQLSMGRGWRAAQREGREVTAAMLDAARESTAGGGTGLAVAPGGADVPRAPRISGGAAAQPPDGELAADSLGLGLLAALADGEQPLRGAWELARARYPQHSAGECLALAERAVDSLLRSRLIVLRRTAHGDAGGEITDDTEIESLLRAIDSWNTAPADDREGTTGVWIGKV